MEKLKLNSLAQFTQAEKGRLTTLAKVLGIRDSYLSQMISGERPMPPRLCPVVEKFSKGVVRRQECRPEDGHLIWPTKSSRQGAVHA